MFPKYPYLDLSDRNLDFLTKAIREMESEVKNFVSLNAVKYANPIQWSINRQYEKNTIVIDPLTGTAFISLQPVPYGVALTRTQYWTPVFDLSQFVTKAASNFANSYERDITTTATMPTGAGDWVVWDSTLYVALNAIHAGDAYVVGGNIKRMTVEDFYDLLMEAIRELDGRIDDEITNRQSADSALGGRIDSEIRDRQDADTALGGRIDDEIRDRQDADTALGGRIDNEIRDRQGADTALGGKIGTLSDLTTTNKDNLVDAINELDAELFGLNGKYNMSNLAPFKNTTMCIVGDSISSNTTYPPNWTIPFTEVLSTVNCTVNNIAADGASVVGWGNDFTLIPDNCTYYVVFLGVNDFIGQWTYDQIVTAVSRIASRCVRTGSVAYYVSPIHYIEAANQNPTNLSPLMAYRRMLERLFNDAGFKVVTGLGAPTLTPSTKTTYMHDGLHPDPTYRYILSDYILDNMIANSCTFSSGGTIKTTQSTVQLGTGTVELNWSADYVDITFSISRASLSATWNDVVKLSNQVGAYGLIPSGVYFPNYFKDASGNEYFMQYANGQLQMMPFAGAGTYTITGTLRVPLFYTNNLM